MRWSLISPIAVGLAALVVSAPIAGYAAEASCVPNVSFQWVSPTTVRMWTDATFEPGLALSTSAMRRDVYARYYLPDDIDLARIVAKQDSEDEAKLRADVARTAEEARQATAATNDAAARLAAIQKEAD